MHRIFLIMGICCIAYEVCLGERSCIFSDGYIKSGTEGYGSGGVDFKSMGQTDTEQDCAMRVIYLEPAALGATWYPTALGGAALDPLGLIDMSWHKNTCYAVFGGEIRFEDTTRSCIFQEYEHFSQLCKWKQYYSVHRTKRI